MVWMLITWKEFINRKMLDKSSVVNIEVPEEAIKNLKQMNAQKRLTTTDYSAYNLDEVFAKQGLKIVENIITE